MAINRFSYVPEQRTINTYAPLPFQEMALAGANLQKDQDLAETELQNASEVFKIKNLPFEAHAKTARTKEAEYQTALKGIAENLSSGIMKPFEAEQQASSLLQKFQSDPIVRGLNQDVEQRTAQEKHLEGQKEKADKELYDQSYTQFQQEFTADPSKRYVAPLYSRQKEDVIKDKWEPAIDDMMDSFTEKGKLHKVQDRYGDWHYTLNKTGGINENDIRNHLLPGVVPMLQSQAGEYWLDRFFNQPNLKYENLTKEQKQLAKQAFGEQFVGRAKAKIHSEVSNTEKYDYAPEYVAKEQENKALGVYDTPMTDVPGAGLDTNVFAPQKGALEQIGAFFGGIGDPNSGSNYKGVIPQPKELPEKEKQFSLNYMKSFFPELYSKQESNKLTKEEAVSVYSQIAKAMDMANKEIAVNSSIRQLDPVERTEAIDIFGDSNKSVKDIGTGIGGNLKYYVKDLNKTLTYDQLAEEFPEEAKIDINAKFDPKNPYVLVTGDKSFANARQLYIDGREVIVSGPAGYVDVKNKGNHPKNLEVKTDKAINEIYNAKFNPGSGTQKRIYGQDVLMTFIPSKEDPSNGIWRAKIGDGDVKTYNSPEEIEMELTQNVAGK